MDSHLVFEKKGPGKCSKSVLRLKSFSRCDGKTEGKAELEEM